MKSIKNKEKSLGFTMIELLIVIVILGLLASLVAPKMFSKIGSSQRSTAATQMQMFETALDTYRLDMGSYPNALEDLRKSENPRWDGPYLPKAIPLDPWGNEYFYAKEPSGDYQYTLMSYGADGQQAGSEDNADILHK
jgi:general secretion pathway protein G